MNISFSIRSKLAGFAVLGLAFTLGVAGLGFWGKNGSSTSSVFGMLSGYRFESN